MSENDRAAQVLAKLVETIQDLFIFQALESGLPVQSVKSLVHVKTDRVTRISKIRRTRAKNKESSDAAVSY